jgi:hypothetical protein
MHNTVRYRNRTSLDHRGKFGPLVIIEDRYQTGRFPHRQTLGPLLVEPENPVADDLQCYTGNLCSFAAAVPVQYQCNSPQTTRLVRIAAAACKPSQIPARVIRSDLNRCTHCKPTRVCKVEP